MAKKISYPDYLALLSDPATTDEQILAVSVVRKGRSGFDFELRPDPKKVAMTPDLEELENALQIGNNVSRWRRQVTFRNRLNSGEKLPVLVEEGDSWHQFPLLIKDVIDQLGKDYLIYSVGAAGDTAQNMVYGPTGDYGNEYLAALWAQRKHAKGFLFSAAGNDIIGEDPETGVAVLHDMLKNFNGNVSDVAGHINMSVLAQKIAYLDEAYRHVIGNIRQYKEFAKLPIFIHGYDYAFPYPDGPDDPRKPKHAKKNEWLGEPLDARKIKDRDLRRNIIKFLVDALYDMLGDIAGDPKQTNIWLVDCRGAMPDVSDWIDEIHGTNDGFAKVTARFRKVLKKAGVS